MTHHACTCHIQHKEYCQISSVQLLSRVQLFATPWTAARQASLAFTISRSLPRCMSIELAISSSVVTFFCLHSFPASGSFLMSWLLTSGGQSTGASASASFVPVNVQGWFSLRLRGLISLHSKGLWRVFSSTTVWKHQFFSAQPSWSTLKYTVIGLPWWSSGKDSALPMQGAWVLSLVRELDLTCCN